MRLSDDPWELPSARTFLAEIESEASEGGGVVIGGPSLPPRLDGALERHFRERSFLVEHVQPNPGMPPSEAVAQPFGAIAEAEALARATGLADHLAIIDGAALDGSALSRWYVFLGRFLRVRSDLGSGLSILLLVPGTVPAPANVRSLGWNGRLRRIDVTIWADLHAPLDRAEPLATLGAALAVDLCGWRLDLAAELAGARRQDLLDPFGWLKLRSGQGAPSRCRLNGKVMECPLALCERGRMEEVHTRVWRAQVTALFPWLETLRQQVVERHGNILRTIKSAHPSPSDVSALEFGSLARWLRNRLGRAELEMLDSLGVVRNELAHRRAVKPAILDKALREVQQFEDGA